MPLPQSPEKPRLALPDRLRYVVHYFFFSYPRQEGLAREHRHTEVVAELAGRHDDVRLEGVHVRLKLGELALVYLHAYPLVFQSLPETLGSRRGRGHPRSARNQDPLLLSHPLLLR